MDDISIDVIVADDHPSVIFGVTSALSEQPAIHVVSSGTNSTELMVALDRQTCDVLVSDYGMPGGAFGDGLALFGLLRRRYPRLPIVVLTMQDNVRVIQSLLKLGIQCILSKADDIEHLSEAIRSAHAGMPYFSPTIEKMIPSVEPGASGDGTPSLTARETEVLRLLLTGMTVSEIAAKLGRTKQTVSSQKYNAMRKFGVSTDVELFRYAFDQGMTLGGKEQEA
ncbi:response regulator [Burkholderia pyrrocinia]